ncbi:MAG TPA: universal stress protein [Planosporangium sp.]|jgi:nucleotide-binding universal stress UspA family protein|nr:universal stress protein [Planosporangium sp.]
MNSYRIVVGVDGAEPGWWALAWAADEAAATGGRLLVCRVYGSRGPVPVTAPRPPTARPPTATLELADPVLVRHVSAVRDRLGADLVDLAAPVGDPGPQLVDAGGDLLVVGAPGARPSTARWVAAHARCPVVVVRPLGGPNGPFAGHIVVGVDGGEPAGAALAFGFRYATRHGLPLAAIHAAGAHHDAAPGDVWVDDRFAETHLEPPPAGLTLLDAEVEPQIRDHPRVAVRRAVHRGDAVPALLRAAAGARLLVVGDRGRGAAARVLLGSVSQGVVARAVGPVAVVHAGPHGHLC